MSRWKMKAPTDYMPVGAGSENKILDIFGEQLFSTKKAQKELGFKLAADPVDRLRETVLQYILNPGRCPRPYTQACWYTGCTGC